jgi:hypothetical protein
VVGGQAEDLVDRRLAEIRVDEQDAPSRLGEDDGQVRRGDRLALVGSGARHEERPDRRIDRGELDVRPQRAVRLGDAGARVQQRSQPVDLAPAAFGTDREDRPESAQVHDLLDVIRVLHRVVELLGEEGDPRDHQQPEGRGEEDVEERRGRDR